MDDADRAQLLQEQHLAAALERAASMARQALGHHATSTTCQECNLPIEPARIAHGFGTCASCAREQWDMEMRRRRR